MSAQPPCLNRPPREPYYLANDATTWDGRQQRRLIPSAFVDRCATHDGRGIGPSGESYAEAQGWLPWCVQCRWYPHAQ